MASIPHACGTGGLSAQCGHSVQWRYMATCVFYTTLLNFVFAGKLGISRMDLGLVCRSLCGHRRRQPLRSKTMMTVLVANSVATVMVIYLSVALAT